MEVGQFSPKIHPVPGSARGFRMSSHETDHADACPSSSRKLETEIQAKFNQ